MGFDSDQVCDAVDSALDSSGVGKIPGVSELSNGLCKGFAGKIVGGIIDGGGELLEEGAELAEEGACEVYSWFGGECNDDVKKPSDQQKVQNFCKPHGGMASMEFSSMADYAINCNNHMKCRAQPGKPLRCTTLAQAEASYNAAVAEAKKKEQANIKGFQAGSQEYYVRFGQNYIQPCPDDQCVKEMSQLRTVLLVDAKKIYVLNPLDEWWVIETQIRPKELEKTTLIKQAAAARMVQKNQEITDNASKGWEQIFISKWSKECPNQACIDNVKILNVFPVTAFCANALTDKNNDNNKK